MKNGNRPTKPGFRFTIRAKLLLLSFTLLSIPYVGYQYMRELEQQLRLNLETSLTNAARAIAGPLHENYQLFPYWQSEPDKSLFIHSLDSPIQIDGYTDDWINYLDWMDSYRAVSGADDQGPSFKLILGQREQYLYVLLQVRDDKLVYHQPSSERTADSDHVQLVIGDDYQVSDQYYFAPAAPGRFNPYQIQYVFDEWGDVEYKYIRYITNIAAEWQPAENGYNLEIALPLYMINQRMGFIVSDVDSQGARAAIKRTGTAGPDTKKSPGRLVKPSNKIVKMIAALDDTPGRRIWVLDRHGQVLASAGNLKHDVSRHPLNIFYKMILPSVTERFHDDLAGASRLQGEEVRAALKGKTDSRWRLSPDGKAVIVSAATPIRVSNNVSGVVVVEETTNNIQMLQRHALVKLLNKTLIVFTTITLLLLLFATRLSFRLRRLSREAAQAIDEYGRVTGDMPVSRAGDEIGDLSRSYSAMLERLKQYNNYLESLAGKLSHELRTPMTVVQSSLDNLQSEIEGKDNVYLDRARDGMHRLHSLVTRLSEAARLDQALQSAELETVDLCHLVRQAAEGYKLAYQNNEFRLEVPVTSVVKKISPDLFLQMMDKIVSNAIDFSAVSTPIDIELADYDSKLKLDIINYGSTLPQDMEGQLFNSMISVREKNKNAAPHLGLGLYIARMIAEFHGGQIRAKNLEDGKGVCFSMIFPV